jgi:hypothetical protein
VILSKLTLAETILYPRRMHFPEVMVLFLLVALFAVLLIVVTRRD